MLRARYFVALAILFLSVAARAAPLPSAVTIDSPRAFPESITSTSDGALIMGSIATGTIFRAPPGALIAEPWIMPEIAGARAVAGVLADERSGTLYACANHPPADASPRTRQESMLAAFDLKTGALKASYVFPYAGEAFCNDIAVGKDGTAYITDTRMPGILRLRRTAAKLEVWARRPDLTGKLDGLAFGDDGALYVNAVDTGAIFRIRLNPDGSPGAVAKIKTSRPLESPDGMRPVGGNRFIIGENRAGRLALMSVHGDTADVETLAEGFETPAGVTAVGDIAWVANGKLNYLNNPTMKGQDPGAFTVAPVPLRGGR